MNGSEDLTGPADCLEGVILSSLLIMCQMTANLICIDEVS